MIARMYNNRVVLSVPRNEIPVLKRLREKHGVWLSGLFFAGLRRTEEYQKIRRELDAAVDLNEVEHLLRSNECVVFPNAEQMYIALHEMCYRGLIRLDLRDMRNPGGYHIRRFGNSEKREIVLLGPCLA